ncbi:MAG TPA: hypothetical protein VN137_14250 [Sphingomonas sp.]|nr:hypothetical protein [Sphingomonas sp.]
MSEGQLLERRVRIGPNVAPFTNVSMPSNLSPFFFFERTPKRYGFTASIQAKPTDTLTITPDGLYSKTKFAEQQTGLAYDFSGGILVDQIVQNGEAVY